MSSYVLNTWYPLTWSRNVGRQLSPHRIIEKDVVVYRTEAGKPVALAAHQVKVVDVTGAGDAFSAAV